MSARVRWSEQPDDGYRRWIERSGALLADPSWVDPVARALGSKPLYGFDADADAGVAVHRFRRFALTIAYAGLPMSPAWLASAERRARLRIPSAILTRFNFTSLASASGAASGERAIAQPESVIPDLSVWPVRSAKKIRKDRAFATRAGLRVDDLVPMHAASVEAMYRGTVERHRGRLRYGESYFRAVIEFSTRDARVCARGAFDENGILVGFAIFGREGDIACYLHGGVDPAARGRGTSDLLLGDALDRAIAAGATAATLLPSPPQQAGLTAFKRKWAEEERIWTTFDRAESPLGRLALAGLSLATRVR